MEDVEQLDIKFAEIMVKFDNGLLPGGDELGHMCMIISEKKYCKELNDPTLVYVAPV